MNFFYQCRVRAKGYISVIDSNFFFFQLLTPTSSGKIYSELIKQRKDVLVSLPARTWYNFSFEKLFVHFLKKNIFLIISYKFSLRRYGFKINFSIILLKIFVFQPVNVSFLNNKIIQFLAYRGRTCRIYLRLK